MAVTEANAGRSYRNFPALLRPAKAGPKL